MEMLGYEPDPAKRGGLQDLSSDRRVNLIIDTQTKMARGYGSWRQSQDPTILNVWPADELYRAITRTKERDWQARWNAARSKLGSRTTATLATFASGPFVALKNDEIWERISRFGNPYPPFDYMSGMRVRDVSRSRAEALKVLRPGSIAHPTKDPLNQPWTVKLSNVPEALTNALQTAFQGRAVRSDAGLHILPDPDSTLKELVYRAANNEKASGAIAFVSTEQRRALEQALQVTASADTTVSIDADHIRHILSTHSDDDAERARGQIPVSAADMVALPKVIAQSTLRRPRKGELNKMGPHDMVFESSDGHIVGVEYGAKNRRLMVHTLFKKVLK